MKRFFTIAFFLYAIVTAAGLQAAVRPTYDQLLKKLPGLWEERYPVNAVSFEPFQVNKRILYGMDRNGSVYYYRVKVIMPVETRGKDDAMERRSTRKSELWVRYRPGAATPYDITFARQDLLPGKNKRWLRG